MRPFLIHYLFQLLHEYAESLIIPPYPSFLQVLKMIIIALYSQQYSDLTHMEKLPNIDDLRLGGDEREIFLTQLKQAVNLLCFSRHFAVRAFHFICQTGISQLKKKKRGKNGIFIHLTYSSMIGLQWQIIVILEPSSISYKSELIRLRPGVLHWNHK